MLVNENLNSQNLLSVGNNITSNVKASVSQQSSKNDFSSYLNQASEKDYSTKTETKDSNKNVSEIKTSTDKSSNMESADKLTDHNKVYSETKEAVQDKNDTVDNTTELNESSEIAEVVQKEPSNLESQEDLDVILEVLADFIQSVAKELNVSIEEVSEQLEQMDFNVEDLTQSNNLKDLFLSIKDATPTDLITDENLNQELQDFTQVVEDIVSELTSLDLDEIDMDNDFMQSVLATIQDQVLDDVPVENLMVEDSQQQTIPVNEEEPTVVVETQVDTTENESQQVANQTTDNNSNSNESDHTSSSSEVKKNTSHQRLSDKATNVQDFKENVLQNIQNAVDQVEMPITEEVSVRPSEVVRQIVEQVKIQISQDSTSLEMQLYPEHLGRIQINVVSKEGIMTAQIVAETEAAKQAIETGLLNLKESMEQQNLKVEAIEVMVSTTGFDKNDDDHNAENQGGKSKNNRKIDLSNLDGTVTDEEDLVEVEKMKAVGSSVSYTI